MSSVHGKRTQITVAAVNISPWCNTSEFTQGADKHDTTGYGADDHVVEGGLGTGDFTMGGTLNNTAVTGPRFSVRPLKGTTAVFTRMVEGAGAGKPLETFSALIEEYKETSPVGDFVKWAAKCTVSGPVVTTAQP